MYLRKSKNVHTSSKNILFHISYLKLTEYKFSSLLDELITADFNIFEVLDNGWVRMGRGQVVSLSNYHHSLPIAICPC